MNGDPPIVELILGHLNKEALDEHQSERLLLWLADSNNLEKLVARFGDPVWLAQQLKILDGIGERAGAPVKYS